MKDPMFSKGTGMTSVFSFGCNPGIASHFVRHGLTAATGLEDTRAAAKAFGLRAVSFNERDTQWGKPGSEGEKLLLSTQCDVLYNTWSPGNYIVETAESTILYAGCPEEAKTISSAGPAVIGWVPSGPNIGFLAPHDETFTIQQWFDEEIPAGECSALQSTARCSAAACYYRSLLLTSFISFLFLCYFACAVFVYEAPPTARAYIKGGRQQHSSVAKATLLTPAKYDLGDKGYDMLGALLFSNKPGVAPFWCGITLDVEAARLTDPTGSVGPTPFQVTGGLFSALQFVLQHPNSGDCFPEDVPTPFVVKHAFPWAGAIIARPAPEALGVASLFDPGSPASLAQILAGEPKEGRTEVKDSAIAGKGVFAAADLAQSTALTQLSFDVSLPEAVAATQYNHACGDAANAYVDRNRAVRTSKAITAGTEITIDYSLYQTAGPAPALSGFACACKAGACRGTIGDATTVPAAERKAVASTFAIIGDEALLAL